MKKITSLLMIAVIVVASMIGAGFVYADTDNRETPILPLNPGVSYDVSDNDETDPTDPIPVKPKNDDTSDGSLPTADGSSELPSVLIPNDTTQPTTTKAAVVDASKFTVTLSATKYTYNGKAKKPTVTVKDTKGKSVASSNYSLKYTSNKNVGKACVTITFKGNYKGTQKKYFTIVPAATKLTKLTAGKKSFTAKWKKQATQTTGYQIQYSTSSKFKSGNKTVTVKSAKTLSKTVKSLKKGKKYYVRVRTYKTVSGTKYCSSWSAAKSVKTK